jgi:hypothetical protein
MSTFTHRIAEARSLALHTEVARQLKLRPETLDDARVRVAGWLETGSVARPWAEEWSKILSGTLDDVITAITDNGEHARSLRQTSPFAGTIDPRRRWKILSEVREESVPDDP